VKWPADQVANQGWIPRRARTCGAFTPDGEFLELPELDLERLEAAWQEAVFALYLAQDKIDTEVAENMRSWQHSGFSVDQSVFLPAGDQPGIERLVRCMTRCPFSLSRLVKVTETGQVIYKAEKQSCRAFPAPDGDGIVSGPKRNFQILWALDFLAEFKRAHSAEGRAPDPVLWVKKLPMAVRGAGAEKKIPIPRCLSVMMSHRWLLLLRIPAEWPRHGNQCFLDVHLHGR